MYGDNTDHINIYNPKEARGFDSKFAFVCFVILKDSLFNKVIIINMPLIAFQKIIIL